MNSEVLAEAIQNLINQPDLELQFSKTGRAKVIANFNSDLSAIKLKALILGHAQ